MGLFSRQPQPITDRERVRLLAQMVETQIAARGVRDERVLAALRGVPRDLFLPVAEREEAFEDHPLRIGHGQTASQPYIVGLMLEALALCGTERVLEVGTGCGYQTALLARLAGSVVTIERIPELAASARERLIDFGIEAEAVVGDGSLGWIDRAPYDRIVVTAAAPEVPLTLVGQLGEGGRLVIPVGDREEQMLVRITRRGNRTESEDLCPCRFVPLLGEEGFEP